MAGLMRVALGLALTLVPCAASADPILTPLIIGGLGSIGVTVAPGAASFIGGLLLTGALVVYSYLNRPEVPKPDDGTFSKKQSTPPRDYAMGRCRKSGPWLFGEVTSGGVANVIIAIQDGWTDAIENTVLHNDVVTIGENDFVQPVDSIRYGDFTKVQYRLGRSNQSAYGWVKQNFPEVYDDDCRLDGVTTIMVSCASPSAKTFQRTFPNGFPEPSVIGRFGRFYDPRKSEHDPGDERTWEWSENPFVLLLNYKCFHPHGDRRRPQDVMRSTEALWKQAMSVCDERVNLSTGGSIARYACGGSWDALTERKAVVGEILKSCDGWLAEAGDGSLVPFAGRYYPPDDDFVLNADNILALSLQLGVPAEDRAKAVVVTFTSPDHVYAETECDAWGEEELQDAGVAVERAAFPVPWVHHFVQARMLAKRESGRLKARVRGVVTADMSGLNVLRRRYVSLDWPLFGATRNIVVEVRKVTLNLLAGSVAIEFVKANPNIDAWNPETDEGLRPPIPAPTNTSVNPVPPQPTLVQLRRRIQLSSPRIEEFPSAELRAEYRLDDGDWERMRVPDSDKLVAVTDILDRDGSYEFRACYMLGTYPGFWSPSAFMTFETDVVTPPRPERTRADLDPDDVTVHLSCRAGDDPDNTRKLRFYRRPQGQAWDVATATLVKRVSARASDVREVEDAPGAGTWNYDFVAENASGAPGARAEDTRTVTVS